MTKMLDLYDSIITRRINNNPRILDKEKALSRIRDWSSRSDIFSKVPDEGDMWEFEGTEVNSSGNSLVDLLDFGLDEDIGDKEELILGWQKYYENLPPLFDELEEERGEYGRTELHMACVSGDLEAVRELLDSGADWTLVDNHGYNCLTLAYLEDQKEIIEELERRGIKE